MFRKPYATDNQEREKYKEWNPHSCFDPRARETRGRNKTEKKQISAGDKRNNGNSGMDASLFLLFEQLQSLFEFITERNVANAGPFFEFIFFH